MKIVTALALTIFLNACSAKDHQQSPTSENESQASVNTKDTHGAPKPVPGLEIYPTLQPDGSPLDTEYCEVAGREPGSPFENLKVCAMVACKTGDDKSCKVAETYNDNLSK